MPQNTSKSFGDDTETNPAKKRGKREINAEAVRRKILEASRKLISEIGYQEATITRIRKLADVSIATFYKYFDSKQGILFALLRDEQEFYEQLVIDTIQSDIDNPVDYVVSIILAALDPPSDLAQKAMWREILAASILLSSDTERVGGLESERSFYCAQMLEALNKLIDKGHLSKDAPLDDVVNVIYCISAHEFQEFVCGRYSDRDSFHDHLRRLIASLVAPWMMKDGPAAKM